MNKNAQEKESFEEETGKEETQGQPLDHRSHNSKSKPKKRRPKRGGCGGLAGDAMTGLAGDATTGLAGDATTGLAGGATTGLAGGATTGLAGDAVIGVFQSTKVIRKDATITKEDVKLLTPSDVPYSLDLLMGSLNQVVGKKATRRIREGAILEKTMVK